MLFSFQEKKKKRKRLLHKMGPSTFLQEGWEPLVRPQAPCSLLPPLHHPGPESHAAVRTMLPRRAVKKNPSVSPTPTNNFRRPFGSQEGFLLENAQAFSRCALATLFSVLPAGRGVTSGAGVPVHPPLLPLASLQLQPSVLQPPGSRLLAHLGSLNFVVNKICCFCVSMFTVRH